MRLDVFELPSMALNVVGSARKKVEYNEAHEELRAAVAVEAAAAGLPPFPWDSARLTVVCFVGEQSNDGRFRPECAHTLHPVLDPIYRALKDVHVVESMEAILDIRTVLVPHSAVEGFRIEVMPTRAEGPPIETALEPTETVEKA